MGRNKGATCETCPYFCPGAGLDVKGTCRHNAPYQQNGYYDIWPRVRFDSWCGDHPDFWKKGAAKFGRGD